MTQEGDLSNSSKKIGLKLFLKSDHSRSVTAKKNILALVLIKGLSVITSLLLIPLTIEYLNPENYGVWLTLYGIVSWFGFLDIGLGNGLRNKFAEAIACGDKKAARTYVSTTYALLAIIMAAALLLFFIVNHFLNWSLILNISDEKGEEIKKVALVIFGFFFIQLVFKLISSVLFAGHKAAFAASINTLSSIISLIITYILLKTTTGSLLYLAVSVGTINVLMPLLAGWFFYKTYFKDYAPSLKHVDFKYAKSLMNIGVMFFLFQSSAIIVVATDNIIISQLFGPEEVTPYNIALKYFAPVTIVFNIISTPLWSAYTEAYAQNDTDWIKRTTKKMIQVWLLVCVGIIPMVLVSGFIYKIWIGENVNISLNLTAWVAVYILLSSWNLIFGNFINGVGKLRLAFYLTLITAIINIPLCIILSKYAGLGISGIIIASSLSLLPDIIFLPVQYLKIVNKTAKGIWNK